MGTDRIIVQHTIQDRFIEVLKEILTKSGPDPALPNVVSIQTKSRLQELVSKLSRMVLLLYLAGMVKRLYRERLSFPPYLREWTSQLRYGLRRRSGLSQCLLL